MRKHRFAIGDRVRYRAVEFGNSDIDGWEGTVIYIDDTPCPYTVRFDEPWLGGMGEERTGNAKANSMRCWFARECNLEAAEPSSPKANSQGTRLCRVRMSQSVKKNESETAMNKDFKWSPETEAELLRLKGEKKSNAEIAYAMGITVSAVKNRLVYMKARAKKDGTTRSPEEAGQLGDLEAAMAETIRELTAERDGLAERLAVYEKDYATLLEKNEACLSQVAEGMQEVERLRGEIEDSGEALIRTEEQLDAAMAEAAAHLTKVAEQVKTISGLEARIAELESELKAEREDTQTLRETVAIRNQDIDELTERLERAADKAGQLLTQCLMMGN